MPRPSTKTSTSPDPHSADRTQCNRVTTDHYGLGVPDVELNDETDDSALNSPCLPFMTARSSYQIGPDGVTGGGDLIVGTSGLRRDRDPCGAAEHITDELGSEVCVIG